MKVTNPSIKKLVILTTHFGDNFSGGSTATHEIFQDLQHQFEEIIVVCRKIGHHTFSKLNFKTYRNFRDAMKILKSLGDDRTIFYGDFYNSIWFVWTKKTFYFTYHDNWPEMTHVSKKDFFRSFFYLPVYQSIFRNAKSVIVVSEYKKKYVSAYTRSVYLVRNGFNKNSFTTKNQVSLPAKILMVGNIEKRKYKYACRLFRKIDRDFPAEIHIFGHILDRALSGKLESFGFVRIMDYQKSIPYENYRCLLHTSMIENLPLSICESLYYSIPVIAFNVGGIAEVVNETNGILIEPFDLDSMLLSIDQVIYNEVILSFKKNDLSEYDWKLASQKYADILLK